MSYLQSKLPEFSPAVVVEPWRKALMDAAELIRVRGLAKRTRCDDSGAVCVIGALSIIETGAPVGIDEFSPAIQRICAHVGGGDDWFQLARWNNAPGRTAEAVIRALTECAQS